MTQTAAKILKSSDVEIDGRFQIGVGTAGTSQPPGRKPAAGVPQVRIVERQGDFAVIEFACSCGQKTRIKCGFAPHDPNSGAKAPTKQK